MENQTFDTQYSENILPMSLQELESLRKKRSKVIFAVIAVFVLFSAILYYLISQKTDTFFMGMAIVFGLFIISVLGFMSWSVTRDINFGKKKVVRGRIDEKKTHTTRSRSTKTSSSSSTTYYYFIISGREIKIEMSDYERFHAGDIIEIEMMPKSSDILKISRLQSNLATIKDNNASFVSKPNLNISQNHQIIDTAVLTSQDRILIQNRRNSHIIWTLGIGAIIGFFLFVGLIIFILLVDMPSIFIIPVILRKYLLWIVIAAMIGAILLVAYKIMSPFMRDLSQGKKNIILAIIEDKERSSSSGQHSLYIGGKSYNVPPETFNKVQGGQTVLLHIAPHSNTFLRIEEC